MLTTVKSNKAKRQMNLHEYLRDFWLRVCVQNDEVIKIIIATKRSSTDCHEKAQHVVL